MEGRRIYLDNAASTPIDPSVREAMIDAMALSGNASAIHAAGRASRAAIDGARTSVAELLDAEEREIVFTSGATESNATAILGYLRAIRERAASAELHVLTSPFEHASVKAALAAAKAMFGVAVEELPLDDGAAVAADAVAARIRPETSLVCMMWVNNVFGTVQPVEAAGAAVRAERKRRGSGAAPIAFLTDAVQAVGKIDVSPYDVGADLLTLSAHKISGPKGVGGLFIRDGVAFGALIGGGRQERGRRGGTENLVGIAGFGAAAALAARTLSVEQPRLSALRKRFVEGLRGVPGFVRVIGAEGPSAPHVVYALFRQEGDFLVVTLDVEGIAASSGSACDTGTRKTSDVLALVCDAREARRGGVRFSFGRNTTEEDIDSTLEVLRRNAAR